MAEEQFQERTERATPKRIKEAREKGQIARSRELNTAAVMIAGSAALFLLSEPLSRGVTNIVRDGLVIERALAYDESAMATRLADMIGQALLTLIPFLAICTIVAVMAPALLGGWTFSVKALAFKAEKLNPIAGIKRLFSLRSALELVKALAKFLVVGAAAILLLNQLAADFLALGAEAVGPALGHTAWLCAVALLVMSCVLLLIAAVDVPFQLWDHGRKLRMTRQEVRDEHKETEGQPEVKSRIRTVQQEMARRRMMEQVPEADVIVTNPEHYAVALRFTDGMRAPTVLAKGAELIAHQIRKIGAAHGVPIVEAPPLARALYATAKIGEEIPAQLYKAVAQVLAYVYTRRDALAAGADLPDPPEIDLEHDA